jgi:carbonic anhydrase
MFRDETVKEELRKRAPSAKAEIGSMTFGQITGSLPDNVRKSLTFLKDSPLIPEELKTKMRGFVFHLESGKLEEVL